jgi:hypothetical protein
VNNPADLDDLSRSEKGGFLLPTLMKRGEPAKKKWKRLASSPEAMNILTMANLTAFAAAARRSPGGKKRRSSS